MKLISVKKIGKGNLKNCFRLSLEAETPADETAIKILSNEAGDDDYIWCKGVYTLTLSHANLIYGIVKLSRFMNYD